MYGGKCDIVMRCGGYGSSETLFVPIAGFRGKYPSNATPRICHVTLIARNQMDVNVGDRLARGWAIVDANVVGLRGEFAVELPLLTAYELE
jgi:hypothetical protein